MVQSLSATVAIMELQMSAQRKEDQYVHRDAQGRIYVRERSGGYDRIRTERPGEGGILNAIARALSALFR